MTSEYDRIADTLAREADALDLPDGWQVRDRRNWGVKYEHTDLPITLWVTIQDLTSTLERPSVRGRVRLYDGITCGEYQVGSPEAVMSWAEDWMASHPHPIALLEDSRCSWWPGKRTPTPDEGKEDIGVIRPPEGSA